MKSGILFQSDPLWNDDASGAVSDIFSNSSHPENADDAWGT
eukprot:CAMPEP_0195042700 /NCGR_PEP_ID=MMETSP0347-20130606/3052_1 /TAXON_ID=2932 /ORGANISM="Alexandrium fundyense, Strain CCMP1719" /LENGTH=40 /DNA_ID= /DNA_START= /DNA_END= /DNA_ORIENTATION=